MRYPRHYFRKGVFVFFIGALIFVSNGCDFSWRQYYSREYRFLVLLPRGWQEAEDPKLAILVKAPQEGPDDRFQENINVIVTELPASVALSTFFELNKDELMRVMPGAHNMIEGEIFAGLVPGKMLSFDNQVEDLTLRTLSATWIKGKRVYVVTCVGQVSDFSKYSPIFKKVLQSMRLK